MAGARIEDQGFYSQEVTKLDTLGRPRSRALEESPQQR